MERKDGVIGPGNKWLKDAVYYSQTMELLGVIWWTGIRKSKQL